MKVYYILVHMCFAPIDLPVYDCNSFYWPEQFTLNNCVKMLPIKKDEIEQQFKKNNLNECVYENYDLKDITDFKKLIKSSSNFNGLNVTIPYKKVIIPFLDELSKEAKSINAVNTIVFKYNKYRL